ncbi:MAG: hypothetical protein QG653_640 [Patescibacteria group bacterium]|nr:hypothetical protein [Patescibacteria group bacterium]
MFGEGLVKVPMQATSRVAGGVGVHVERPTVNRCRDVLFRFSQLAFRLLTAVVVLARHACFPPYFFPAGE